MFRCKWEEPGRDEETVEREGMYIEAVTRDNIVRAVVVSDQEPRRLILINLDKLRFDGYAG